MKRMNKFIVSVLVLFFISSSLFSENIKLKAVDDKSVLFVGKVTVVYDGNRDLIPEYRGYADEEYEAVDVYTLPFFNDGTFSSELKAAMFSLKNKKNLFNNGDFFYGTYKVDKQTREVNFKDVSKYYFNSIEKAYIYLPFVFDVSVPEGVNVAYLGSFIFYVTGDNFTIDRIELVDEYDLANEFLKQNTTDEFKLFRANIRQ